MTYHDENEFDEDDFDEYTIACPNCGQNIYDDVDMCPHCRQFVIDRRPSVWSSKPSWIRHLAIAIILFTIIAFAFPWLNTLLAMLGLW